MTYIYGLRRKGDTQFRYVGKANDPQARLAAHMTEAFRDHVRTHKNNWLRSVGRKDVEYVVLEEVSSDQWKIRERYWIGHLRAEGHPLTNHLDGGGGVSTHSATSRERMSERAKGRVISRAQKEAVSRFHTGRKRSVLTVEKMRKAQQKRTIHPMSGKKQTPETRRKISESVRRAWLKRKTL